MIDTVAVNPPGCLPNWVNSSRGTAGDLVRELRERAEMARADDQRQRRKRRPNTATTAIGALTPGGRSSSSAFPHGPTSLWSCIASGVW